MDASAVCLRACLDAVPDQRHHNRVYPLTDVLLMALFATLAGAEHFTDFEEYCTLRLAWFKDNLGVQHVPSHDTFAAVFRTVDYRSFECALRSWTCHLLQDSVFGPPDIVSLDGKALNGAQDYANIVSAWSANHGLTLGGVATEGAKQNELQAMVTLVSQLRLKGAVVTADAAGTYAALADAVCAKGGDYVLPVKGNQGNTLETVKLCFDVPFAPWNTVRTLDKTGGRVEERTYEVLPVGKRALPFTEKWQKLAAVARVTSVVTRQDKVSTTQRFYITSLTDTDLFARAVRAHWGVENGLHWQLDVVFREDDCPARDANAQKNLNTLRKLVHNTLKKRGAGKSIRSERKRAGWSEDYFDTLTGAFLKR